MLRAAQACGKAEVVRNDNGRVQALEIQDDHWLVIEARFWLHHQRDSFHCWLPAHLLSSWCYLHVKSCPWNLATAQVLTTINSLVQLLNHIEGATLQVDNVNPPIPPEQFDLAHNMLLDGCNWCQNVCLLT
jgi:hypothetical protein